MGAKKPAGRAPKLQPRGTAVPKTERRATNPAKSKQRIPRETPASKPVCETAKDIQAPRRSKSGGGRHMSRAFAVSIAPGTVATILATVLSLIFAGVPFVQSLMAGPEYEMRNIDVGMSVDMATRKGLSATAFVITNVGDERGDLLSVIHDADRDMRVCFPDTDDDGGIRMDEDGHGVIHMLGKRMVSLEPGQAQLMFFVSPDGQAELIETRDGPALAYRTPLLGETYTLLDTEDRRTRIHASEASDEFAARFIEDPLYPEAMEGCKRLVDLERRNTR